MGGREPEYPDAVQGQVSSSLPSLELTSGVATRAPGEQEIGGPPAIRTRDEIREHFAPTGADPGWSRRVANITIHQTTDPEVIAAKFGYQGTAADSGTPVAVPGIFVLRVRNGEIVSSRDYFDHLTAARVRGQLDALIDAVR